MTTLRFSRELARKLERDSLTDMKGLNPSEEFLELMTRWINLVPDGQRLEFRDGLEYTGYEGLLISRKYCVEDV